MKRLTEQWKEEVLITRFTLLMSTRKKGILGCTHTYKIAILQLVITEEIFSKEIMKNQLQDA